MADLLHHLLTSYIVDDNHIEEYVPFILSCLRLRPLLFSSSQSSTQHKWSTRLNSLLQSKCAGARWSAICLVRVTAEQSEELYTENVVGWCSALLGIMGRPEPIVTLKEAMETLTFLISKTQNRPELQREVTTVYLPKLNSLMVDSLRMNAELVPTILHSLSKFFTLFPTTCRPISEKTQTLCLQYLDGQTDPALLEHAAQCLATTTKSDTWRNILLKLVGSANEILDRLLDTIEEENSSKQIDRFQLPPVALDYIIGFPILLTRFQALSKSIVKFLSIKTLVAVQVPMGPLIDLICRVFNVYEGSLMSENKDKAEYLTMLCCIPMLHLHANEILVSMILCCGDHMLRYSSLISSILLRLLSQNVKQNTIRVSVYRTLSLCIQRFGISFAESICTSVVVQLLEDLKLPEVASTIEADLVQTGAAKNKSNKKRKIITNSDAIAANIEPPNIQLQVAVLEVWQALLHNTSSSIPPAARQTIDQVVLTYVTLASQDPTIAPHINTQLKKALYASLSASVQCPTEGVASIVSHAVRIFTAGINDSCWELQNFCAQALTICDLVIHPPLPPLLRQANHTSNKSKNEVSGSILLETTVKQPIFVRQKEIVQKASTMVVESGNESNRMDIKDTEMREKVDATATLNQEHSQTIENPVTEEKNVQNITDFKNRKAAMPTVPPATFSAPSLNLTSTPTQPPSEPLQAQDQMQVKNNRPSLSEPKAIPAPSISATAQVQSKPDPLQQRERPATPTLENSNSAEESDDDIVMEPRGSDEELSDW
ncbi:uncharacterized protein VTP21DRAFT_7646 [Calcarisporiella thermophila]|uniref:uncharacterized protein n=1 Tax=Calcarisporiella thermophila TaxID=911321 RepID=UPI003744490A